MLPIDPGHERSIFQAQTIAVYCIQPPDLLKLEVVLILLP